MSKNSLGTETRLPTTKQCPQTRLTKSAIVIYCLVSSLVCLSKLCLQTCFYVSAILVSKERYELITNLISVGQ